ncbi:hypothetical protein AAOGI_09670 [Agarivorans albus]
MHEFVRHKITLIKYCVSNNQSAGFIIANTTHSTFSMTNTTLFVIDQIQKKPSNVGLIAIFVTLKY